MPERRPLDAWIRFCPACGQEAFARISVKELLCSQCRFRLFQSPATAAAAILECGQEILLTVRADEPGRGLLDLPGGFIDPAESAEDGMRRELREELGLEIGALRYLFSFPNEYPYGGVLYHTTDLFFLGRLAEKPALAAQDDISGILWVPRQAIPFERIHAVSIRNGLASYAAGG